MADYDAVAVHDAEISRRIKRRYSAEDVEELLSWLTARGTLSFRCLPTGLYPAASLDPKAAVESGYGNVWVRDNVYVAWAHQCAGSADAAALTVRRLAAFYQRHRGRFAAIVAGNVDPGLPMNRPQVRFNGLDLAELATPWSQAQNDALGYFLWLYCRLGRAGRLDPDRELLALFALYFDAIRYWEDEDSGHWEERRKIEASSIGAVVAGLEELRRGILEGAIETPRFADLEITPARLGQLIGAGRSALTAILPAECVQPDPRKFRRYDAALLFLVYPLAVVDDAMAQQIVNDVLGNLKGEYGIRRYLGDSYWTADYKEKVAASERTADVSEHQDARDALARPGEEAQWCIFDPIVSVIAGRHYLRTGDEEHLDRQVRHFNRSLGQLTGPECPQGALLCPEAYYRERGRYVPNDHVPLLWTQANLWLALLAMRESSARTKFA